MIKALFTIAALLLLGSLPAGAAEWTWSQMSTGAPTTTSLYTRVFWTGHELLVWGARNPDSSGPYVHRAWRWSPKTRAVRPISLVNAPAVPADSGQSCVWTGRHLLVWGGRSGSTTGDDTNNGYLYDPLTDSWVPISTNGAPPGVQTHNMAWAGDMVLAIGEDVFALAPVGPFRADGLPDAWQERFFADNAAMAGPRADPDGDGWNNELEWRFGTDPTEAASRPALRIEMGGGVARVSFPDPDPLLAFQLQSTDDLRAPFTALAVPVTRAKGWIHWSVPSQARAAEFFRLVVTTP